MHRVEKSTQTDKVALTDDHRGQDGLEHDDAAHAEEHVCVVDNGRRLLADVVVQHNHHYGERQVCGEPQRSGHLRGTSQCISGDSVLRADFS